MVELLPYKLFRACFTNVEFYLSLIYFEITGSDYYIYPEVGIYKRKQESKKTRKKERKNSTKKAIKKKRKQGKNKI